MRRGNEIPRRFVWRIAQRSLATFGCAVGCRPGISHFAEISPGEETTNRDLPSGFRKSLPSSSALGLSLSWSAVFANAVVAAIFTSKNRSGKGLAGLGGIVAQYWLIV